MRGALLYNSVTFEDRLLNPKRYLLADRCLKEFHKQISNRQPPPPGPVGVKNVKKNTLTQRSMSKWTKYCQPIQDYSFCQD